MTSWLILVLFGISCYWLGRKLSTREAIIQPGYVKAQPRDKRGRFVSKQMLMTQQLKREVAR